MTAVLAAPSAPSSFRLLTAFCTRCSVLQGCCPSCSPLCTPGPCWCVTQAEQHSQSSASNGPPLRARPSCLECHTALSSFLFCLSPPPRPTFWQAGLLPWGALKRYLLSDGKWEGRPPWETEEGGHESQRGYQRIHTKHLICLFRLVKGRFWKSLAGYIYKDQRTWLRGTGRDPRSCGPTSV